DGFLNIKFKSIHNNKFATAPVGPASYKPRKYNSLRGFLFYIEFNDHRGGGLRVAIRKFSNLTIFHYFFNLNMEEFF
ncbi:MAG: hypothetical protein JSW33_01550, partial [bacterium]